jgi:hypothetical protein
MWPFRQHLIASRTFSDSGTELVHTALTVQGEKSHHRSFIPLSSMPVPSRRPNNLEPSSRIPALTARFFLL